MSLTPMQINTVLEQSDNNHFGLLAWFEQHAGQVLTWKQLQQAPDTVTISAPVGAFAGRGDRARGGAVHTHRFLHRHRGRLLPRHQGQAGPVLRRPGGRHRMRTAWRSGRNHLRRRLRDPACAHGRAGRCGDAAQLRQPAPQRRPISRGAARIHRARGRYRFAGLGRREHPLPERDGRPHHAAPAAGAARARARSHGPGRRRTGHGRELHPVGHRRQLRGRASRLGPRGRGTGRIGTAL